MLGLTLFVVSVALADSANPSTVAPALYLATTRQGARAVAQFTLGVFIVLLGGGLVLTLGPGRLLVSLIPRPGPHATHLLELLVGIAALVAAGALWLAREWIARRLARPRRPGGRSAFLLGAGIMAVELPTAFPYFAVIATVLESGQSIGAQLALVALFCVVFVLPLVAILAVRALTPTSGSELLERLHGQVHRHAAILIPLLLLLVAAVLIPLGLGGLAGE